MFFFTVVSYYFFFWFFRFEGNFVYSKKMTQYRLCVTPQLKFVGNSKQTRLFKRSVTQ